MRRYLLILVALACAWFAPTALADRLVSQEPRFIQRRTIVERDDLPDYRYGTENRIHRVIRYRDLDDDDYDDYDDDDFDYDDDDDDEARVVIRRPHRVVRRVIIRD